MEIPPPNDANDGQPDIDFSQINFDLGGELNNAPEGQDDARVERPEPITDMPAFIKDLEKTRAAEKKVDAAIDAAKKSAVPSEERGELSYLFLSEHDDDAYAIFTYDYSYQLDEAVPNMAIARNDDELKRMMAAADDYLDFSNNSPRGDGYIDYVLDHEGEHAAGFKSIDRSNIDTFYTLRFEGTPAESGIGIRFEPGTLVENTDLSKLGLAAVNIYPSEPSVGDKEFIRAIGYADEQEVIDRIIAHNNSRGMSPREYPLPKWYNPKKGQ